MQCVVDGFGKEHERFCQIYLFMVEQAAFVNEISCGRTIHTSAESGSSHHDSLTLLHENWYMQQIAEI
ncbi:unnamed protein product [Cochlearia groenlandica]